MVMEGKSYRTRQALENALEEKLPPPMLTTSTTSAPTVSESNGLSSNQSQAVASTTEQNSAVDMKAVTGKSEVKRGHSSKPSWRWDVVSLETIFFQSSFFQYFS